MAAEAKDHRHGHRQRLRERLLAGGESALADYEILELLLMFAIPRRDVKPLAKTLITTFRSYSAVLAADAESLMSVPGMGESAAAVIKAVQASSAVLAKADAKSRPTLSNWSAVQAYLQTQMAGLAREQFRLLFLDRKNQLLGDEVMSDGTVDHTAVYPREVVRRALANNATALILVHNHPSGIAEPSKADIEMTRELDKACSAIGIQIHDHIIVAKNGQSSLRDMGLF